MAKANPKRQAKQPAAKKSKEPAKGKKVMFPIDQISFHPELQARVGDSSTPIGGLYGDHLEDLVRAVKGGNILPRVRVWTVPGKGNFCTDGHHTTEAHKRAGKTEVAVELFTGEWADAVLDSTSANRHDGAPKKLTNAEKRRNVKHTLKVLKESGQKWSANRIAKHCNVGDDLVKAITDEMFPPEKTEPVAHAPLPAPPKEEKAAVKEEAKPSETKVDPVATATPAVFDVRKLDADMGAIYRDIDDCARSFGELTAARTDTIRHLAQDFKKEFLEWMRELVMAKGK